METLDPDAQDPRLAVTPEEAVARLLRHIGLDPTNDAIAETPARVVKALTEMTSGYGQDPAAILKAFESPSDEIVIVRGIPFASMCEHHMLPFTGVAHVAYLPKGKVAGLSKIPRLVHCFARRLQMQERMTAEIADALEKNIGARGVAVVVRGVHTCCALRGIRSANEMVTSSMRGVFRDDATARAEVLQLIGPV